MTMTMPTPTARPRLRRAGSRARRAAASVLLPAEWAPQDGVLLAWPHAGTDWAAQLPEAEAVFAAIAAAVSRFEHVLLVVPPGAAEAVRQTLCRAGARLTRVRLAELPTDDTWARDFGPLAVRRDGRLDLLDFTFNGWGGKYPAARDNRVTAGLHAAGVFHPRCRRRTPRLVLEGGSLESDGHGTLLTTPSCLLNPNRNPHLDRRGVEAALRRWLGARRVLWLEHGALAGDDTDGHIDTLARFAPRSTILHQACDDPRDAHFADLDAMARELAAFRTAAGRPYRLLPLPWPAPCRAPDGHRLPATYANFLVLNGAVLVPAYRQPARDAAARTVIAKAFPGRQVLGIDCLPLLRQHGSLHCVTLHLPRGVLAR
jgi:agmatine deiminase